MTAQAAWTPASRPGIIPLHPLTFGTILGRSFAALRQNPRVLLGFALCVQTVAYLVLIVAIGAIAWATFSRLDTLLPGTDEYDAVMAGSIAITAISGIILTLAVGALTTIVQGVVVSEVAHAAVAEKLPLGALWRRVKPVAWRLIGYAFLVATAALLAVALVVAVLIAIGRAAPVLAVVLAVLSVLAAIPLAMWLSTKLILTPAAILLEGARVFEAVARSWRLIRGRFWPALGISVVIAIVFSVVGQIVSVPFSMIFGWIGATIAPTGAGDVGSIVTIILAGFVTEAVTLLVQSVSLIVQATAASLIYIDCRMRREGLDLDLLSYVERRDAGEHPLPDPYLVGVGRNFVRPYAPAPAGYAPAGYAPPAYPGQAPYPGASAYPAQPGQPAYPAQPGHPAYPAQGQAYPQGYPAPHAAAAPYPPQPSGPPHQEHAPIPQPQPPAADPPPYAPPPSAPAQPQPEPGASAPSTQWTAPGAATPQPGAQDPWR
ncbi:hypothetical protein AB1K54_05630 [Microbacterium sp. BWT-B31]|uniref:hypothetical protein n=1 Tax=Microbacterium sp. BWT-B31 TaxID=3232072 RepID=UPI0035276E04